MSGHREIRVKYRFERTYSEFVTTQRTSEKTHAPVNRISICSHGLHDNRPHMKVQENWVTSGLSHTLVPDSYNAEGGRVAYTAARHIPPLQDMGRVETRDVPNTGRNKATTFVCFHRRPPKSRRIQMSPKRVQIAGSFRIDGLFERFGIEHLHRGGGGSCTTSLDD